MCEEHQEEIQIATMGNTDRHAAAGGEGGEGGKGGGGEVSTKASQQSRPPLSLSLKDKEE